MSEKYKIKLLDTIDLDPGSKLVTVEITETKPSFWLGTNEVKYEATFTYLEGLWIGYNNTVIKEEELCYLLQEALVAKEAEKRLDRYITTL